MQRSSWTRLSLPLVAAGAAALIAAGPSPTNPDDAEIRKTIQYYFDGAATVEKAFLPQATMLFVRDGQLVTVPITDYVKRVQSATKDPSEPEPVKRIVSIDIAGTAATAKLELRRPDMLVTDYMSLLKVDGRWLIVNKIFDRKVR